MEFWGVEVKAGEPKKVNPVPGMVIHLSQACLGETKSKTNEHILLNVKVGEQKLVLGLLSLDKFPQLTFDLVFEQPFELSHNWKGGSIHFCGYQTDAHQDDGDDFDEDFDEESDEEAEVPLAITNGESDKKVEKPNQAVVKTNSAAAAKPESSGKPKVPIAAVKKDDKDEDSDDSDDDSDDAGGSSDDDSDEEMVDGDDSDDDDGEDGSDDETPKKPELGKKRPNESASKTPVPAKKGKGETPSKSEGKKGNVHVATPHPAKKGAKTPGTTVTGEKANSQSPKSGGVTCKSCSRTFGTDKALESHTKAKHV